MPTPVVMPRFGETVESCVLVQWLVEAGQHVERGASIATIETDKTEFDVEAPVSGTILSLLVAGGDEVPVLTDIAWIGDPRETPPSSAGTSAPTTGLQEAPADRQPAAAPSVASADRDTSPPPGQRPNASPRARRAAADAGIDLGGLSGSGPDGRITEEDVEQALARSESVPIVEPTVEDAPHTLLVRGARKVIAERMRDSLASTAQLSLMTSFDATQLLRLRQDLHLSGQQGLRVPSVTDVIVLETARALQDHPDLNAHFLGDSIARFDHVHIGIAVDTPRGLLVPVLRNADTLDLVSIAEAVEILTERTREGTITPDELRGGTFTVTNMGMLGIEAFTPILNPPEVAILGVGAPVLKLVERGERIEHIRSIGLSLTIDHQAVDGAPAARFLQSLVARLEAPSSHERT